MTWFADHFECPAILLHLGLVVVYAGLWLMVRRRRRRLLEEWPGIQRIANREQRGRVRRMAIHCMGLACLVIAIAGPRGNSPEKQMTKPGRDVMLVLDVSRSMAAEQPSRLDKAIRTLRPLAAGKQLPPGTRVGLVVFAARPWLAFPLTGDLGHLGVVLDQLAGGDFPPEVSGDTDGFVSGTRLGAALKLASASFPKTRPGRQDVIVLSDGDDPIADDEWRDGVAAAKSRELPVHTVAVGEPGVKATIPYRGDVLRFEGEIVTTAVERSRLEETARRTGGLSLAVERGDIPLAGLLARHWAALPTPADDSETTIDVRPARRTPWLVAALLALLATEGFGWPKKWAMPRWRTALVGIAVLGFVAAEAESPGDAELRRGQDAFARRDYAAAIEHFDKAQPRIADPGLAAFNRAAARFRLGQFVAAAADYRRALDDAAVPVERRDRAWYDLGNCLLHQAGTTDRPLLEDAVTAYKQCLAGEPDASLKRDVEHNLLIAVQRYQKLLPPENKGGADSNPNPKADDPKNPGATKDKSSKESSLSKETPKDKGSSDKNPPESGDSKSKSPALGSITVLPDRADPVNALSLEIQRIAEQRRRELRARDAAPPRGKDW